MLKGIKKIRNIIRPFKAWGYLPLVVFLLILCGSLKTTNASENSYKNDYVKAAYIFKLANFVTWPTDQQTNNICVIGSDAIGLSLAQIQRSSKDLEKWDILQKYITSSFDDCQILFLSNEQEENIEQILFSVKEKPILTVSDNRNFIGNDGIIGFVSENRKIKLEVNQAQSKRQDLTLSSKLMNVSVRVIK